MCFCEGGIGVSFVLSPSLTLTCYLMRSVIIDIFGWKFCPKFDFIA